MAKNSDCEKFCLKNLTQNFKNFVKKPNFWKKSLKFTIFSQILTFFAKKSNLNPSTLTELLQL